MNCIILLQYLIVHHSKSAHLPASVQDWTCISLSSLCDTQECLLHCWYCLLKFLFPFLTFVQMSVSGNISEVMEEANQSCSLNCMAKGMGSGEILAINTDGSWSGLLLSSFSTAFLLACPQLLIEALSVLTLSWGTLSLHLFLLYAMLLPKKVPACCTL